MKGCARSCLTGLFGLFAAIGAFHLWFRTLGLENDTPQPGSIVAGVLAALCFSLLWSAGGVLRHRGLLLGALSGVAPLDGKWAGLSGTIRSSSPLTSPISRTSAVAFKYRIHQTVGSGKQRHQVSHYEGTALAASTISTNLGSYRLLAVPNFDLSSSEVEASTARRNAEAYIAATRFETRKTAKEHRQTVLKEWTDDDGVFRRDRKGTDTVDLDSCRFDEQIIAQGEQICVLGLYSQARGGIIPDPNWAHQTQVIRGDGEAGVRRLGSRALKYAIAGLIFGAAVAFVCWAVITGRWTP
jgi:hypothetical protein